MRDCISLILTLLFLACMSSHAQEPERLTSAEAKRQIQEYLDEINMLWQEKRDTYGAEEAKILMGDAFSRAGVGWAKRYIDSWGGWLYVDWDKAQKFYDRHRYRLETSIRAIYQQGYATPADMQYLAEGMSQWRRIEPDIDRIFSDYVRFQARRAKLLDEEKKWRDCSFSGPETQRNYCKRQAQRTRQRIESEIDPPMRRIKAKIRELQSLEVFSSLKAGEREPVVQVDEPEEECRCRTVTRTDVPDFAARVQRMRAQAEAAMMVNMPATFEMNGF